MKNWENYFQGKKVTVMGLGVLGRGIADTRFLVETGAEITVTDLKSKKDLKSALEELKDLGIKYALGKHKKSDFTNADFILKNAAVPPDSKFLKIARFNDIPIEMDETLFLKLMPENVDVVGVTGTRGKTSTTYIIYEILKELSGRKVFLAGNIQGKATLPLLKKVESGDIVVLELSSWQLQGLGEVHISPNIAVWTNLYPDHLDYYKGSMEAYINDKKQIYKYQDEDDFFIYNAEDSFFNEILTEVSSDIIPFSKDEVSEDWDLKIRGDHNRSNIAAALKVAEIYNLSKNKVKKVVENFLGVEYRLQYVGEYKGIKFYNDTTSTTPVASLKALQSFPENEVILIAGGFDKNLDLKEWAKYLQKNISKLVLLKGTGTKRLKDVLTELDAVHIIKGEYNELELALKQAISLADKDSILLFSPGFASFGMFKNEYDRGEKFNKLLHNYIK